jgi:hypothetical protein
MIRMPVSGISVIGRNTQGVRLVNLAGGEGELLPEHRGGRHPRRERGSLAVDPAGWSNGASGVDGFQPAPTDPTPADDSATETESSVPPRDRTLRDGTTRPANRPAHA